MSGIDDITKYFNLLVPGGIMAVVGIPENTKPMNIFLASIVVRTCFRPQPETFFEWRFPVKYVLQSALVAGN